MIALNFFPMAALALLLSLVSSNTLAQSERYLLREDVREYLDTVSREHDLDRLRLSGFFSRLKRNERVLELISRPAERTLTWKDYRPIFMTTERVDAGRAFVQEHRELLVRAEERYGVPLEIIAAIIGVETYYGRITGSFGVLETLATLKFDYPPRSEFFGNELTEFLVLAEKEGWDVVDILGSYAGAMGMPQFISSSYRLYAVDFDKDGKRDLFTSVADIVGSVGNYLNRHGWVRGAPVAERWQPENGVKGPMRLLVSKSLRPMIEPETVVRMGFKSDLLEAGTREGEQISVMTFDGDKEEELWIGYQNFYAITRYNHSRMYALAVFQLAQALADKA